MLSFDNEDADDVSYCIFVGQCTICIIFENDLLAKFLSREYMCCLIILFAVTLIGALRLMFDIYNLTEGGSLRFRT